MFLIGERRDNGGTESHIVFLQNLAAATGEFPPNLNDKINFYILRATDGTIFYSRKDLGVYCKLGPIALLTFLKPNKLKDVKYTRIRLKGKIFTAQKISNPRIANFVFLTRQNEVMGDVSFSEKQQKVIEKSYLENYEKALESMTVKAFESDSILKK